MILIKKSSSVLFQEEFLMKFNEKLVTRYNEIKWVQDTLKKSELEDKNVLFQQDDRNNYISKMFRKIIG